MMRGLLFVCLILSFASIAEANMKLSELTKSNMSFKKSYKTSTYSGNDKSHRDSTKRFESDAYGGYDKSFYEQDKRFSTDSYYDQGKRAGGYDGSYASPELRNIDSKSRFYDSNKELFLKNKDRDLTRDYAGKADFSKKKSMHDMVENLYDDLMDKSMSDINKYHSQTARGDSRDAGLPIAPANAQEKDSSILDLLDFSKKEIDNSSVKFTLPNSMSHMSAMPKNDIPYVEEVSQSPKEKAIPRAPTNPIMPNYLNPQRNYEQQVPQNPQANQVTLPTQNYQQSPQQNYQKAPQQSTQQSRQNQVQRAYVPTQNSSTQKRTYTVDRPVKDDDADVSIFGIPKSLNSGKVQISVEVKDKN